MSKEATPATIYSSSSGHSEEYDYRIRNENDSFDFFNIEPSVDLIRIKANSALDPSSKSKLGQFFTPSPIGLFMASLFNNIDKDVTLLDPGCGSGSLTSAFIQEAIKRRQVNSVNITAYDIDDKIEPFINETLNICIDALERADIACDAKFILGDFIINETINSGFFTVEQFTHVIMNPPYKKISSNSKHRSALRLISIETVNLYTGFVALAIKKLKLNGELVAIIPRSFCNGLYYAPFRELILRETALNHIHIFESRNRAFSDDQVLQENVILHLTKGAKQRTVTITSSPQADFHLDKDTGTVTASDMTIRTVPFNNIVKPNDKQKFIHIAADNRDQDIIDRLSVFSSSLEDIRVEVSTGPVVDFRLKEDLRNDFEPNSAPLLYPIHINGGIHWPKKSKKPNAIAISENSKKWLWEHSGYFVLTRRFSSKEEKRRIIATIYDSSLPGEMIGFENKLNVFHNKKTGMDRDLAVGLYVYLNCTLLDKYYRLFGGHTQINATDLRNIHYPNTESLKRIGALAKRNDLTQKEIDDLIEGEIVQMTGNDNNPLLAQEKIDQALQILIDLGMPRAQQNERSALTFLALLNLSPNKRWRDIEKPLMGVTPIMDWCKETYGKEYAPNTRETFRRFTLHQFIDGGLCLYNPDKPNRPVNSPKACYQIAPELYDILKLFGTDKWKDALSGWLSLRVTLTAQYAKKRKMQMIPLVLKNGTEIRLSPGKHSKLIYDIVSDFGPRFAPGSEVIYIGDTGAKEDFFRKKRLAELGVTVDRKGKFPDVVLYRPDKDWLFLVEAVTSHGPVDGKRHSELTRLFSGAKPGLVYVTAFPDRKIMAKYLADISWETEVWVSNAPTHLIHFNGDRFLGPHDNDQ